MKKQIVLAFALSMVAISSAQASVRSADPAASNPSADAVAGQKANKAAECTHGAGASFASKADIRPEAAAQSEPSNARSRSRSTNI